MNELTQGDAYKLVMEMQSLRDALAGAAIDTETTRLIEALENALMWGYIAHVAKNGVDYD
jgi:hypothetical protein